MLNCKQATALISQRQEQRLPSFTHWGLRMHLMMCHNCRRFARQINLLQRALSGLTSRLTSAEESDRDGPTMPTEMRQRIRNHLPNGS
ncbi:zf-HC2 domain-containing protein [Ectothiorhodospiraceae bacterium BW-2]|nr:zf-HC2 domain-containing protein [Ectothiorhodospiraceae bacterium BW-2]